AWLSATIRLHAVPEESMVPDLRGIVEDAGFRFVLRRRLDHLFEGLRGQRRIPDEVVEVGHVSRMMLIVMEFQGLGRRVRLQRGLGIGKRGEFECHLSFFPYSELRK